VKLCARLRLALAVFVISAIAQPAFAQLDRQWTTAQAAAKAGAVVNARVLKVEVRRDVNIYTFVEFETLAVAKGTIAPRFTYRMLGGSLNGQEVASGEEMPRFTPGEEVVVFLGPERSEDGYPTLFWHQVYRVTTSRSGVRTVTPPATGLAITSLPGRAAAADPRAPTRLDDFMSAVRLIK
jgi:hypothetical protein